MSGSGVLNKHSTQTAPLTSSGNIDREWQSRYRATALRLQPENARMQDALRDGEWQTVLDVAQSLEAQWAAFGTAAPSFASYRAEAHIGLGHPQEAIFLIDPDPKHRDTTTNLTLALALAMTDQLDAAGTKAVAELCEQGFESIGPGYLTIPVTRDKKIALVRTARALDANSPDPDKYIIREAREALRLDPSQKLAAFVLAEALKRREQYTEARANYQLASTLPGNAGKHAREMVKSIDHKPPGSGPYTSPPNNGGN